MSHPLSLTQLADVIREQAVEATAEKLGLSSPQICRLLNARDERALTTFCEFVRAGSQGIERLHGLGMLSLA